MTTSTPTPSGHEATKHNIQFLLVVIGIGIFALVAIHKTDQNQGSFFRKVPDATVVPAIESTSADPSESEQEETSAMKNNINPPTPSGWFPTDAWLEQCADQETKMRKQNTPEQVFEIVSGWEGYRLGDCIKRCFPCGNFTDSLASLYQERACPADGSAKKSSNATVIDEILQMRDDTPGFVRPGDDEIVIHLRLGDVIENSKDSVATMLTQGGTPEHSPYWDDKKSIKSVYELLDNIQETGASKVTIIGGSHFTVATTKSQPYSQCLRKAIEKAGYQVSLEVNNANPDQDFYRMSHAKYFVVSTGGFSRLIGHNVLRRGGKRIGQNYR